jgi:hypothetical protein
MAVTHRQGSGAAAESLGVAAAHARRARGVQMHVATFAIEGKVDR